MEHINSQQAFLTAQQYIPGGVNSPVRAFSSVNMEPIVYKSAQGARVIDVDNNEYRDFIGSWGPMILGHGPQRVIDKVKAALDRGTSFGAPCCAEAELAQKICELVAGIEKIRFVSSGTEATMSAIRLARGYTGRSKFIKFEGNYHGHSDSLLVSAGSGVATFTIPGTPGVTEGAVRDTLLAQYNDLQSVKAHFERYPQEIAAVIVEPIAGNMGVVAPEPNFLQGLRDLCTQYGAVFIFDEVISGFRAALGGAQELYGIEADLVCYGKIIGGGFPVGAFGGKSKIMSYLAPEGPVYQAGTLSGNPIAMTAGKAMLEELEERRPYEELERLGALLESLLKQSIQEIGAPCTINRVGSVLTLFFTPEKVKSWKEASRARTDDFARYFRLVTEQGFLIAPSQFEALFLSAAHTEEDIRALAAAQEKALVSLYASRE